jgi:hypothetical protein
MTARSGRCPRYLIEACDLAFSHADHYIAAFSSISIFYGDFHILQTPSSTSASQM